VRAIALLSVGALVFGAATVREPVAAVRPVAGQVPAGAGAVTPIPGTPGVAPTPLVEGGPTAGDRRIAFELVLAYPGRAAMQAYAQSVGDPSSSHYRQFLTAAQLGARFGLTDADLARIRAWAGQHGIVIIATSPQRIAVSVDATAGAIEASFGVTLRDFTDPAGRTFHAPTDVPRIPKALDGLVAAIDGLDSRPTELPAFVHPIAAGPQDGMTPPIIDRFYELDGLRALNLHGERQTVAIVSLDTFDPADVATFDKLAGVSGPAVQKVKVSGGVAKPGSGQDEVNLDIDVLRAVAPKAQILDYEAPNRGGAIETVVDQIVKDGRADIVTISWGSCELSRSAAAVARTATTMAAAAAAGVTVYVASGDHGAYGCLDEDATDLRLSVDSPAGDPNVVGVGGTYLSMLQDGTYIHEDTWDQPLTGWAPGGGLSLYNKRPPWQTGPGVDNTKTNGMRQVPDVAAAADPNSGFLTVAGGQRTSGGGTSAASPFWAGFTVLVRQLAESEGAGRLGALGPTLYAVSAAQPPGSVFHDVTRGGNLVDDATPGWDYATGLGTPRGTPLARAIVNHLKGL
jgi:kumamolisin